ncbi:MAG: hypothetical protein NVSMB34_12830 [Variovorax sp.]
MNLIKHEDELWLYPGAEQVFSYRDALALSEFHFDYAYVLTDRGHETIYATFSAKLEGEPSMLNISVEKKPDGRWSREHAIEPGVSGPGALLPQG